MFLYKNYFIFNIALSVVVFIVAFYLFSGKSGGDIALLLFVLMFNFLQIILSSFVSYFLKLKIIPKLILCIILISSIEIITILLFGNEINSVYKTIKYSTTH